MLKNKIAGQLSAQYYGYSIGTRSKHGSEGGVKWSITTLKLPVKFADLVSLELGVTKALGGDVVGVLGNLRRPCFLRTSAVRLRSSDD